MEGLQPGTVSKVVRELRDLQLRGEEGIRVAINEDNIAEVQAEFDGPAGTPYEGGVFQMKLVLGQDYPQSPPKGVFLTKIFHPNISHTGEVCVNVLKKDWKPDLGLRHVLLVIRCLLIEPFPESALNEEAGRLLLEDYAEYAKHARLITSIHAPPSKRSMPLTASGGANAVNSSSHDDAAGAEAANLHAVRKPRGVEKKLLASKKRSLKRL